MTIKFNFYDIYGFALPGFLLLAVLWLPFGLIENKWPDAEFSSALVGVIFAYFAGHVLQTIAHHALPSSLPNGRHPSSVFLDKEDRTFTAESKELLVKRINEVFGIKVVPDLSTIATADLSPEAAEKFRKKVDSMRNDVFFLCRSALIKSKTVVYAEQFEGLYALMRGLSAAFAIGGVYYLGWAYAGLLQPIKTFGFVPSVFLAWKWSGLVVLAAMTVALVSATIFSRSERNSDSFKRAKWMMVSSLLVAFFATGYYLGISRMGASEHRGVLIALAVFSFFAAERCHASYKVFAAEFAKAVYRDFINYDPPRPQRANELDDNNSIEP